MNVPEYHYPVVAEPYASALREAVGYVTERFTPVLGIIAAGSILRGQGDARSDIDMFVIFEGDYRQRVQKRFQGVRFELFANPPRRMPRYFEEEQREGSPSTAHMIATGHVIYSAIPLIYELRAEAQSKLAEPPRYDPADLTMRRYFIVDRLENAFDLRERDPEMGGLLLGSAVLDMLPYYFAIHGKYEPRHKEILQILKQENPALAQQFETFQHALLDQRFEIAGELADQILGARGFFEWESMPQSVD